MADDIDIEEHDVFDNPLIRKIFPDISKLKKEIEEEPIIKIEAEEKFSTRIVFEEPLPANNPSPLASEKELTKRATSLWTSDQLSTKKIIPNKIIVGSKPGKIIDKNANKDKNSNINQLLNSVKKTSQVKIILEDISVFIEKKNTYCKICKILFSTKKKFHSHQKTLHDVLNNKAKINVINNKKHKCHKCDLDFSSQVNLKRHFSKYHTKKYKMESKDQVTIHRETRSKTQCLRNKNKEFTCVHCPQTFPDQKSVIEHLYNMLDSDKGKSKKTLTSKEKYEFVNNSISKNKIADKSEQQSSNDDDVHMSDIEPIDFIENSDQTIQHKSQTESIKTDNLSKDNFYNNESAENTRQAEEISTKGEIKYYSCPICSYYMKEKKHYLAHLVKNHRVKQTSLVKRVSFNPCCRVCFNYFNSEDSYSRHIRTQHRKEFTKVIVNITTKDNEVEMNDSDAWKMPQAFKVPFAKFKSVLRTFALKSTIFKCCKCEIHFFSADDAIQHSDHIEILVNWRCPICRLLFKKEGELLHMKQHEVSKRFNIYDVNECNINKYLYNCSKCGVYFQEPYYLPHYFQCGSKPPDSEYCKICDILIDKNSTELHKRLHKQKNMKSSDFIYIVTADILEDADNLPTKKNMKLRVQKGQYDSYKKGWMHVMLVLSYCKTCKSYVTNIARRHKVHTESRCSSIVRHACKRCGLVLTNRALYTHQRLHRIKPDLKLKDFKFLDLFGRQIDPPVPEYPQCDLCKVQFLSKYAAKTHTCSDVAHKKCLKCNIKLSHRAYKMHMSFHNYGTKKVGKDKYKKRTLEHKENIITNNQTNIIRQTTQFIPNSKVTLADVNLIIYTCKNCSISLYGYDRAVEHCQEHYIRNIVTVAPSTCNYCELRFTSESYNVHCKHCSNKERVSNVIVTLDKYYFEAENKVWLKHTFEGFQPEVVEEIISKSIYQFEHRLKLKVIQTGESNIIVYKCDKCRHFVDPTCTKSHIEDKCKKSAQYFPCSICGLSFDTLISQEKHEKIHDDLDISLKALTIVAFNRSEDKFINKLMTRSTSKLHVLYQCRNCNVVVENSNRKTHQCVSVGIEHCNMCGLLVENGHYNAHLQNHTKLENFNDGFMKVVLIGKRENLTKIDNHMIPSYVGMLCNYEVYQCVQCEICIESEQTIAKHVCSSTKFKCAECKILYFSTPYYLNKHVEQHKKDSVYIIDNINIFKVDMTVNKKVPSLPKADAVEDFKAFATNDKDKNVQNVNIFGCKCGLHFFNESKAIKHVNNCNPKLKISKQHCLKCDLLLTPNELFNHLISHHANKEVVFKYNIKELNKRVDSQDDSVK